ncbi:MAG: peroxiredoxin family protein [Pseudomonadota bacterium]
MFFALMISVLMGGELGPPVGSAIPETERFEAMMGDDGATIVFVRSVSWCPFCKRQVKDLAAEASSFSEAGKPLIVVSYDAPPLQRKFADRNALTVSFLSDEGSQVIRAFGLLNESHDPSSRVYGIPHPAVFVVDRNGVVQAKLYESDYASNSKSYRNRPAVETILAAVRGADS